MADEEFDVEASLAQLKARLTEQGIWPDDDDRPRVVPNRRQRRNRKYRPNIKPAPPWSTAPNALIYPND